MGAAQSSNSVSHGLSGAAPTCYAASLPPVLTPSASAFCQKFIKQTRGTVTITSTVAAGLTVTPPPITSTQPGDPATTTTTPTSLVTVTDTSVVSCDGTTITTAFPTFVNYRVRGVDPLQRRGVDEDDISSVLLQERDSLAIPSYLSGKCKSQGLLQTISSACSCFLTSATKTVTTTKQVGTTLSTSIVVVTGAPASTVTQTAAAVTSVVTVFTTTTRTATCTTATVYTGPFSCGVPTPVAGASGTVTCPNVAPPQQTNALFRIEGGSEGNIFDGCIINGPTDITTPSGGGPRRCDGTNNNANPNPGGTFTGQINAAARQEGFAFDGTYSSQFQDFFITSISSTSQADNQFWGLLRNRVFTARGGCGEPSINGDEHLWAFDAFAPGRRFLGVRPEYRVVRAGDSATVTLNVYSVDPSNGNPVPASGANVDGFAIAGADGNLALRVPTTPGCYRYKAENSNAIRSNTFYLAVLPAEG